MFRNNEELYSWVNRLIDQLVAISQDKWASAFYNALRVWGTSGEVLGAIRMVLFDFNNSHIPTELGIEEDVKKAINELNKAFGSR